MNKDFSFISPLSHHHFFGYYYYCPWSYDESRIACLRVDLNHPNTLPQMGSEAEVGWFHEGEFIPISKTKAWNWHQGSMLQWLPNDNLVHNMMNSKGEVWSRSLNFNGEETNRWNRPIFDLHPNGKQALSLSFSRLSKYRACNGYTGARDGEPELPKPNNDGIWLLDLENNKEELVVSLEQISSIKSTEEILQSPHWINHLHWNPSGNRFLITHRWQPKGSVGLKTRCWCFDGDGGRPTLLVDGEFSHWDWRDDETIVAWCEIDKTKAYWALKDTPGRLEPVHDGDGAEIFQPEHLDADGHGTFSLNRNLFISDYPLGQDGSQYLHLINLKNETSEHLVKLNKNPNYNGNIRCDIHPRWDRSGKRILIDTGCRGPRSLAVYNLTNKII